MTISNRQASSPRAYKDIPSFTGCNVTWSGHDATGEQGYHAAPCSFPYGTTRHGYGATISCYSSSFTLSQTNTYTDFHVTVYYSYEDGESLSKYYHIGSSDGSVFQLNSLDLAKEYPVYDWLDE